MADLKKPMAEGLRRWESWLEDSFPLACCRRHDLEGSDPSGAGEAVWQVQIRHGRHGRVRIAADALGLNTDDFLTAIQELERRNWYGALDQNLQIRIGGMGSFSRVE